jgi:hypothetical protein
MNFVLSMQIFVLLHQRFKPKERQYALHDPPKDPLNRYRPNNGTTSQQSGGVWLRLSILPPGGAAGVLRHFF